MTTTSSKPIVSRGRKHADRGVLIADYLRAQAAREAAATIADLMAAPKHTGAV